MTERHGWSFEVGNDAGWVGRGEASPLPGYSPDTLAEVEAALRDWTPTAEIAKSAVPAPPAPPAPAAAVGAVESAVAGIASPAARFAAETALFDLMAQLAGQPLHRWLAPAAMGASVPLGALLPDLAPDAGAAFATAWFARGGRALKRKLGGDVAREVALLAAVRQAAPELALRVDANRGLRVDVAPAVCAKLAALGVACIEEPVPPAALLGMERLPLAIALDESLQDVDAGDVIDRVAARHTLAAVVLKPTALGGLLRCRALAAHAARHGATAIVTHTFDGPVAMAAAAELALALPDVAVAGLAPHDALAVYPAESGAALGDTVVASHGLPGLGLRGVGS